MRKTSTLISTSRLCVFAPLAGLLLYGNASRAATSADRQKRPVVQGQHFRQSDSIDVARVTLSPFISVQQVIKGNAPGVFVQENNGEPGSLQSMMVRGVTSPVFSNREVSGVQPTVYINGIPVLTDHSFVYDVQQYELNPIGSATNLFAGIDLNNVVSMEVIKDPVTLARLGPLAANGAIWIVTKDSFTGKNCTVNASFGVAMPPSQVDMSDASGERAFRSRFFDAYGIAGADQYMPSWLRDTSDPNYYGGSNWADSYYRYAPQVNVNASLAGGSSAANYLFMAGATSNGGVADETDFTRYNIEFFVNIVPLKRLTVNCMVSGNLLQRNRNRNHAERFAEMQLLPSLTMPIGPSSASYGTFLDWYGEAADENNNNMVNSYLDMHYTVGGLTVGTKLLFDYNANRRHIFWPSPLLEEISFVSDYTGFNRRVMWTSTADYALTFNKCHKLEAGLDFTTVGDLHYYSYTRGYDGTNDKNKTSKSGSFTNYYYSDREPGRLMSLSGMLSYSFGDMLNVSALLRTDGYSKVQSDNRWLFTPAFSASFDVKKAWLAQDDFISALSLGASWARVGRLTESDRTALGPQYTSEDLSWLGQSPISSYNGFATITRSYSYGWMNYDMKWPYSEKTSIDLHAGLFGGRIRLSVSGYDNNEKNLVVRTSVPREFGYHYQFSQGMEINNRGVDVTLGATLFHNPKGFSWDMQANLNYNRNKLTRLPGGLTELEYAGRKLVVGESVDRFWLYENQGVYAADADVPTVGGNRLNLGGIAFAAGDPVWRDVNGDNTISDDDRILKGNSTPKFTGGLTGRLSYRKFDLGFHIFFAAGHSALNDRSSQRYDFMTLDTEQSLESVREIFFWQTNHNNDSYPLYNPLSQIRPYRAEQDLFLESLDYVKLRTVSLGYTFTLGNGGKKGDNKDNAYVYVVGNNLLTLTNFSGSDPELVDFTGYYRGYGLPLSPMLTLGARFKF